MSAELLAYSDKIEHLNLKENNDFIELLLHEKSKLQSKLSDSRINLKNNKENLMLVINSLNDLENYFTQNEDENNNIIHNNKNILVQLINKENDLILKQIGDLFKKKNTKEKELINIFHKTYLLFKWEREKMTSHNNEINYMNAKLKEKDQIINTLKKEIHLQVEDKFKYDKNVWINDPRSNNIELINEIACSRDIINKLTEIYEREKISNNKLDEELKTFQKEFEIISKLKFTTLSTHQHSKRNILLNSTILNKQSKSITTKSKLESITIANLNDSDLQSKKQPDCSELIVYIGKEDKEKANTQYFSESHLSRKSKRDLDSMIELLEPVNAEEIQNINFPDKVSMQPHAKQTRIFNLPKLDMSLVLLKYKLQTNKHIPVQNKNNSLKNSNKNLNKKNNKNNNNRHNDLYSNQKAIGVLLENKIKEVKLRLDESKEIIKELEFEKEKFKNVIKQTKFKESKIRENSNLADSKIDKLKKEIKKLMKKDSNEEEDSVGSDFSEDWEDSDESNISYESYEGE